MATETPSPESEVRRFHAPIEQVFNAFVKPRVITQWLGYGLVVEPRLGGQYRITSGPEMVLEAEITVIAYPEQLTVTWEGGYLDLQLAAELGGTTATLVNAHQPLWVDALARLDTYLCRPGRR